MSASLTTPRTGLGVGLGVGFPVADGEQFLLFADGVGGVAVQTAAFEFVAGERSALLDFAGAVEPVGADVLDALERLDPGGGDGGQVLGGGHVAFGKLALRAADRVLVQTGPPDDRVAAVLLGQLPRVVQVGGDELRLLHACARRHASRISRSSASLAVA